MLHEFLTANRPEVIRRCKEQAARRFEPSKIPASVNHGVPLFLQQVVDTLRLERSRPVRNVAASKEAPGASDIGRAAALHGAELLRLGYTIDQVVHEYGDICQAVTAMAVEQQEEISTDEFRTLNRCLDDAIADAVASFGSVRQTVLNDQAQTLQDRLDDFSDEHRRLVGIAMRSYTAIKTGNVGLSGATGTLLTRTLGELHSLAERTLPEIRRATAAAAGSDPAATVQ